MARQLRLRDMGGIIIVDFIDMKEEKNRRLLTDKMIEAMKSDKAKHHVLPPTKFGLVQITRQRVRPEININTEECHCPLCVMVMAKLSQAYSLLIKLKIKFREHINSNKRS